MCIGIGGGGRTSIDVKMLVAVHQSVQRSERTRVSELDDGRPVVSGLIGEEECVRIVLAFQNLLECRLGYRDGNETSLHDVIKGDGGLVVGASWGTKARLRWRSHGGRL